MYRNYELIKNVLAPMKIENGMIRLVKIKKGEIYKYYEEVNYGEKTVFLCKEIKDENVLVGVLKMPRNDFNKYFREV